MKVKISEDEQVFNPFSITFTVESQAEADAIYALFGACRTVDAVRDAFGVTLPYAKMGGFHYSDDACDLLAEALR